MKYVIVLPDGAADEPLPQLDGRTPLEAAAVPSMDWISMNGRLGRARNVPDGFTPATDVATLSVFGYDPAKTYTGRAPLEAAARHLNVRDDQLIFRCNLVTITDGRMADFTADHVDQSEADRIIADLNVRLGDRGCEFHAGVSYRNLMLLSDAASLTLRCQPPHDIPDRLVVDHALSGEGAERITTLMRAAAEILADHPVNAARREIGRAPVTDIWLWGQGRPTVLEPFADRFGPRGAVITGVDIIRGLAVSMGMELIEVPGATGYLDTNYAGKGEHAVAALDRYDLVVAHVEAPDEAGHEGSAARKIEALERTDALIVGPLLEALRRYPAWRILVAPDHPTPVSTRVHSSAPPLFAYAGSDVPERSERPFHDAAALQSGWFLERGHELMRHFIR